MQHEMNQFRGDITLFKHFISFTEILIPNLIENILFSSLYYLYHHIVLTFNSLFSNVHT